MPSRAREVPTLFSELLGVNVAVDPGALPPNLLQFATNWVPSTRFTLIRRPGTVNITNLDLAASPRVLIRLQHDLTRYLYGVFTLSGSGGDVVAVSVNEAPWTLVSGGTFVMRDGTYDIVRYGDFLYIGNGTDPIKQVAIGGSAFDLGPLAVFTNNQGEPTINDDPGSHLLTGTYSYAWAVYNTTTKRWVAVQDNKRSFVIATANDKSVLVPLPLATDYTLQPDDTWHLFLTPVNLPIEFAYDQFPSGVMTFGVTVRAVTVEDQPIPISSRVTRHGEFLIAHRGRIWMAGDRSTLDSRRRVRATSIILPGLEQAIYDRGAFFPALADIALPSGDISGLGVVSIAGGRNDPTAPVAIFTRTQTWLFFGDIVGDPSAALVQRSERIGCIAHRAIAATPLGLIFPGLDSVYLLAPSGDLINVGWPIASVIRAIPPARQNKAVAVFHDGFYKLFVSERSSLTNSVSWWLDLRQGVGQVPSWWGPHRFGDVEAAPDVLAVGTEEARVAERLFGMSRNGIASEHGIGSTDHGTVYLASLRTGLVDLNRPFDRKLATRARLIARPGATTTVTTKVHVDDNDLVPFDTVTLTASGAQWNIDHWNSATWGSSFFQEGDTRADADRPRGLSFALQIDHNASQTIELRDAELALLPVVRPVAD